MFVLKYKRLCKRSKEIEDFPQNVAEIDTATNKVRK